MTNPDMMTNMVKQGVGGFLPQVCGMVYMRWHSKRATLHASPVCNPRLVMTTF